MNNIVLNLKISSSKSSKKNVIAVSAIVYNHVGKIVEKYSTTVENISVNVKTNRFSVLRTGKSLVDIYAHIIALVNKYNCFGVSVWGNTPKIIWDKICFVCKYKGRLEDFPKTFNDIKIKTSKLNPEIRCMPLHTACSMYNITHKCGLNCSDIAIYGYKLYKHVCVTTLIA